MRLSFFIFSIILLFNYFNVIGAETESLRSVLKKTDRRLNSIEQLTYILEQDYSSFLSEDTAHYTVQVSMLRNPKDKYSPNVYFDLEGNIQKNNQVVEHFKRVYDGKKLYSKYQSFSDLQDLEGYYDIKEWGEDYPYQSQFTNLSILSYLFEKNYFRKKNNLLSSLDIKSIQMQNSVINEQECYKIIIEYKDGKDIKNIYEEHFIRKSDYLLIAYMEIADFQDMKNYQYYTINYLDINDANISEEFFKVDTTGLKQFRKTDYESNDSNELKIQEGLDAPGFITKSFDATTIDLNAYKGNIVVLDFWYRGCLPCLRAIPDLVEVDDLYKDRGVMIIGVNYNDNAQQVKEFLEYRNANYSSTYSSKEIVDLYGIESFPTTVIIDQNGKIFKIVIGWGEAYKKNLISIINELL